jgi:hypothetical protein
VKSGPVIYPSSAGELQIEFGINRWVQIHLRGRDSVQQQVGKQTELEAVLCELGLGEIEAANAAAEAWLDRPSTADFSEARAYESGMRSAGLPQWGIALVVVSLIALFIVVVLR